MLIWPPVRNIIRQINNKVSLCALFGIYHQISIVYHEWTLTRFGGTNAPFGCQLICNLESILQTDVTPHFVKKMARFICWAEFELPLSNVPAFDEKWLMNVNNIDCGCIVLWHNLDSPRNNEGLKKWRSNGGWFRIRQKSSTFFIDCFTSDCQNFAVFLRSDDMSSGLLITT